MLKVKNNALIFLGIFVFLVSFILRYKLLFNHFVIDDFRLIISNSFIGSISGLWEVLNPKNFFSVLPIRCGARPITVVSLMIDYHFFNLVPLGYHLTNLILHSINSFLIFLFCYNLKKDEGILFPITASLFYSLHPIQTEVANTISFRADLLLSIFSLISLNLVTLFKEKSSLTYNRMLAFVIFVFASSAFFSKENAIVLPVIIFIYILFFYKNVKLVRYSIFIFVAVLFFFLYFWIERFPVPLYFSFYPNISSNIIPLSNISNYLYTIIISLFYNVCHVLYPVNLSVDYTLIFSKYIFTFTIFFIITVIITLVYTKDRYIKFSALALIIAYMPVSNFVPLVNTIADRYMYFPMIFVSILFGLLVVKLKTVINTKLLLILVVMLFVINTAISYDRGNVYNNQYSLYLDAMIKYPDNPRVIYNMAIAYLENKEYDKSLELLNKLCDINPNYRRELVWFLIGQNYNELKDFEQAKKYYLKALLLAPKKQEFLDKFISMFPSVDAALYYLLINAKGLNDEIILSFRQYDKINNTVEVE